MANNNSNLCPVCGNTIENGICVECGYVSIVFPVVVPESISKFETDRISVMRRRLNNEKSKVADLTKQLDSSRNRIENLARDTDNLHTKNKAQATQIETMHRQISELQSQLRDTNSELRHAREDLRDAQKENEKAVRLPFGFSVSAEGDFVGSLDNGEKSGIGISGKDSGDFYAGQWKFGMKTGLGVEINRDGKKYAGEFRTNRQTGVGVVSYNDGSKFAGEWKNGKRHGGGIKFIANGDRMYAAYEADRPGNSSGAYFLQDGSIVCGQMSENGPTGMCIRYYPDGTTHKENWRNGILQ